MPYCSIEESWKESLIDKQSVLKEERTPLITHSEVNMNNVTEGNNNEDPSSVPVLEYSNYSNHTYDIKIQKILKENEMLKNKIQNLEHQSKTTRHKYLINLFVYIFTGVIILLLLDNIPKTNIPSFRNHY